MTLKHLLIPAVALVVAACAEAPSAPDFSSVQANSHTACTATLASLKTQAQALFGSNAPNVNSVRGKLDNMDSFLRKGKTSQAQQRAHDIVDFVLELYAAGRLSGTEAQVTAFVNAVYCYAGIDIVIGTPEDTWFILPGDAPQILYGLDSSVGVSLPANPVGEPSLLRVERFEGRLNTKLDQYPGFVRITLLNDGGTSLTARATITVCASGLPDDLNPANLRLGHGIRDTGFVITPQPTSADPTPASVACGPVAPPSFAARVASAVRGLFAPKMLEAVQDGDNSFGGGVSGTVTEFSPFAPVDAELSFGGGVSGTVTEFTREGAAALMFSHEGLAPSCSTVVKGSPLAAECQPLVSISTKQGTILEQVPVDWFARSDEDARVAPRLGNTDAISCGVYGLTAATLTSVNGNAGVCWKLGGVGNNRVVAKARAGGDAPAGVWFVHSGTDSVVFDVTVTAPPVVPGAPAELEYVSGEGQSAAAGTPLAAPLVVRVRDANGTPVPNATINWIITLGTGSLAAGSAVSNAEGLVSMSYSPSAGENQVKAYFDDGFIVKWVYFNPTGTTPE